MKNQGSWKERERDGDRERQKYKKIVKQIDRKTDCQRRRYMEIRKTKRWKIERLKDREMDRQSKVG